ncbi:MAG: bifunctional DNA-formamidopyrimidine glycosylase/DNA-(apurinic or apyrimidinic site) lyase [Alphaproteobacteria bacterium]|nr:bifunctional DNA-formamidopyrimidine glycosylase/DNA-(apurinic or apyrimidinic site) lyase [Alphaproteobacteria bacterium]
MPELPEVETVRRGLARVMDGATIARVVVRRGDLRRPLPPRFAERLAGRRVEALERRAKYLIVRLDDGNALLVHLGMSGRMVIDGGTIARFAHDVGPLAAHEHVVIALANGTVVRYADPRRFGLMDLVAGAALADHPLLARLGPEPTDAAFDGRALARRLAGKRTPIKAALLDQTVVAGLGNIYVCESLFRAGLSPRRLARTIGGARADALAAAIHRVLDEAIAAGGSTLRDHRLPSGELGYFQHRFQVYDREGEPCPGCDCGRFIRRIVQAGRSTFYCAARQR